MASLKNLEYRLTPSREEKKSAFSVRSSGSSSRVAIQPVRFNIIMKMPVCVGARVCVSGHTVCEKLLKRGVSSPLSNARRTQINTRMSSRWLGSSLSQLCCGLRLHFCFHLPIATFCPFCGRGVRVRSNCRTASNCWTFWAPSVSDFFADFQ